MYVRFVLCSLTDIKAFEKFGQSLLVYKKNYLYKIFFVLVSAKSKKLFEDTR